MTLFKYNPLQNINLSNNSTKRSSFSVISLVPLLTLILSGCVAAPMAQKPRAEQLNSKIQQHSVSLEQSVQNQVPTLLDLVDIHTLKPLLNRAFDHNPNLQQTAISVLSAQLVTQQKTGARQPKLDINGNGSRIINGSQSSSASYNLGLSASWEVDVWGRLADIEQASRYDEQALQADLHSARNSLAANLIKEWFRYITLKRLVTIEQQRLTSFTGNQAVIRDRYQMGLGSLQDLEAARSNASGTAASLAARQLQLQNSQRIIRRYLGSTDSVDIPLPQQIPQQLSALKPLSAAIIGQRPDLQSAYAQIAAEDLRAQVAYKSLLPRFTLNPTATLSDGHLGNLISASPLWNLLGQLTAPLYNGSQLKVEKEIAELTAEKSYWNYRETLVNALAEVDDVLNAEQSLVTQQHHLSLALTHAQNNRHNYEERYRQGLTDILDLLTSQQQAFSLEIQQQETTLALLQNRIDLGLALGLSISTQPFNSQQNNLLNNSGDTHR